MDTDTAQAQKIDKGSAKFPYTLGIDIGISSIGWSVIKLKKDSNGKLIPQRLIDCGVRVFLNQADEKGKSAAEERRTARSMRRRLRRRKGRLLKLQVVLKEYGIERPDEFKPFYYTKPDGSPYGLRLKALEEVLNDGELYQVLHHLIKYRGFKSNRKDSKKSDNTDYKKAIKSNQERLQKYRTIGEMLVLDEAYAIRKRNTSSFNLAIFTREDIRKELETILDAQINLGHPKVNEKLKEEVLAIFDYQRSYLQTEIIEKSLGQCVFYKEEKRACKYSPYAQMFKIWQDLNNLKIISSTQERPLTPKEKKDIIELTFKYKEVKFTQIRKLLKLSDKERFNRITYPFAFQDVISQKTKNKKYKNPEDSIFIKFETYHLFKDQLNKIKGGLELLHYLSQEDNYDVWEKVVNILWLTYDYQEVKEKLTNIFIEHNKSEFTNEELLNALIEINNIKGTLHLSTKAIKQILPYLKEGEFYSKAVENAIPEEFRKGIPGAGGNEYLPIIQDLNLITNRVVRKSLAQARKLVNAIIREYGSPTYVNIELAREVTLSFEKRKEVEKQQKYNQALNEGIKKILKEEFGISSPSRTDVIKYKLWLEQAHKCGYSGAPIDANILFTNEVQIDHILPWSRSFDDSFNNKILVLSRENQQKGDRTPYEYFGHDTQRWNKMCELWYAWYASNNSTKYKYLTLQNFNEKENDFLSKNLNDTRHISKFLKNYIENNLKFAPIDSDVKQRVYVFNGAFTAALRRSFNFKKYREESLRHHALDAIIIGIGNLSLNLIIQKRLLNNKDKNDRIELPEPWPRFAEDVYVRVFEDNPYEKLTELGIIDQYEPELQKYIKPLIVSRAPYRRIKGKLHEDTIRSYVELPDSNGKVKSYLVSRIELKKLTKDHFQKNLIFNSDQKLIQRLKERLANNDWKAEKAFAEPFYLDENKKVLISKIKVLEDTSSYVVLPRGYACKSSIVRTDVFRLNGKTYLVPIYIDQVYTSISQTGKLPNKAIVSDKPEKDWIDVSEAEFLFSLYPNDYIKIYEKGKLKVEGYYRTVHRNAGSIGLIKHDYPANTPPSKKGYYGVNKCVIEKYQVDLLGRLYKVNKEKRTSFHFKY